MPAALPYVWWRGGRFDANSIPSLLTVEKRSGLPVRVTQGGYNAGGVKASAGTHDGGAVIDISVSGWSRAQINNMLIWLRRCGWAAWYRTPAQGFVYHIHAVRIGDGSASRGAQAQVVSYRNGRNGLLSNRADDGPKVGYVTWENSKYNPKNAPKPYVIQGKKYAPYSGPVYVDSLAKARSAKKKYVSRPVHRVQLWLANPKAGGYYKGKTDGIWGPATQKALDDFRRKKLKWNAKDSSGAFGITSLRKLRDVVKSGYKVGVKPHVQVQ